MTAFFADTLRLVAIVPCHNEESAVSQVVADLRAAVPQMTVYVYDNASTDRTSECARLAGAEVRREPMRGKGNVIRRAMADLDADVYLMIDGDDTYDASAAPEMIRVLLEGPYDQVTGVRVATGDGAYRSGHALGNHVFNKVVSVIFRRPVNDMLSGYRVFSRRFVKSFPAVSRAFEIETELTVHAINTRVPQAEVEVGFKDRAPGSASKLRTYHDGFRILRMISKLLHHERPLALYSTLATVMALVAVGVSIPVIRAYFETGLVGRFPTAFLAASLVVVAFIVLVVGILLDGLRKVRQEMTRIAYMATPPPPCQASSLRAALGDAARSDLKARMSSPSTSVGGTLTSSVTARVPR
ncbi:glycosyltransferase family 2 protein [Knoellia aerolata]|uniref:RfbJ protein n=1 Tax=Knoellia aerolata DSM 18566 TaxID=1385519 RepID=A0A0A0JUN9_9MICO|nr:glycosyltransferase family 2 protein [Knoellia aerolata]KGN40868.1 RfbJ protein [Knoellia aerolata DSM 18566]